MDLAPFLTARRQVLRQELERRGLAGAIITDPNHFFYLTGLLPNLNFPSLLALDAERAVAVVPQYGVNTSALPAASDPLEVMAYPNLTLADLSRFVDEYAERERAFAAAIHELGLAGRPVGVDAHYFPIWLAQAAGFAPEHLHDVGEFLYHQRIIKDVWEQEQLAFAVRLNDIGFAAAQAALRPGVSDYDAFSAAWRAMAAHLGGAFDLHGEFSGGPAITGQGGCAPVGYTFQAGDLLIADIYPVIRGYQADTTRTFVVGAPAPWQREWHAVLEDALARGEAAIRPGLPAAELDHIVRGYVERHMPSGGSMFHHAGHGIGIAVGKGAHYPPFVVPHSPDILQEGMVLTLEPGLYVPGKGGMRLEDNYIVTANGCRPLGTFPKTLVECG